jgi:hypothetical protein
MVWAHRNHPVLAAVLAFAAWFLWVGVVELGLWCASR